MTPFTPEQIAYIKRIAKQSAQQAIGGPHSTTMVHSAKDANGVLIKDHGKGEQTVVEQTVNQYITQGDTSTPGSITGSFNKDHCIAFQDGSIQFAMTDQKSQPHFARYRIRRKAAPLDYPVQAHGYGVMPITGGIPYAVDWAASMSVTANTTAVVPTSPDDSSIWICTSAGTGTTDATEPTWVGTKVTEATSGIVWEQLSPGGNSSDLYDTNYSGGAGAHVNGVTLVKCGTTATYQGWDYSWGQGADKSGSTNLSGMYLLYSYAGGAFKAFRHFGNTVKAKVVSIKYSGIVSDATYDYELPLEVTINRPLVDLPKGDGWCLDANNINEPTYSVKSYVAQSNGEIYTVLTCNETISLTDGIYAYKATSGNLNLPDPGDEVSFRIHTVSTETRNHYYTFQNVVPVPIDGQLAAIVHYTVHPLTAGNPQEKFFIYKWPSLYGRASIETIDIDGFYAGTDWDDTSGEMVAAYTEWEIADVEAGNGDGWCFALVRTWDSGGTYYSDIYTGYNSSAAKLTVSVNGASTADTFASGENGFCLCTMAEYTPKQTNVHTYHTCVAYAVNTAMTVYSLRTASTFHSATMKAITYNGTIRAGRFAAYDVSANDPAALRYVNYVAVGAGGESVSFIDETGQNETLSDFSSLLPSYTDNHQTKSSNGQWITVRGSTYKTFLHFKLRCNIGVTNTSMDVESFIVHSDDSATQDSNFTGAVVGDDFAFTLRALDTTDTYSGSYVERLYIVKELDSDAHVATIDGSITRVGGGLIDSVASQFTLHGENTAGKENMLDVIASTDIIANSLKIGTLDSGTRYLSKVEGADNYLVKTWNGDLVITDMAASDVMLKSDYDTDGDGIVDQSELAFVPTLISADMTIPSGYELAVHNTFEIGSGVTLTIEGSLVLD